jgi:hypothetical protein
MIARWIVAAALAASVAAPSAVAQTPADTGAMTTRTSRAEAQAHVVDALLQKGDLEAASREFGILVRDYADQESLVRPLGERLRSIAENGPGLVLGVIQDGKYRHHWTGVEVTAPAGWTFTVQSAGAGGVDKVELADAKSPASGAFVTFRRVNTAPARIADRLLARFQDKISQMRTISRGYIAYRLRPDSVQRRTISGQQAWSAEGEYVNAKGQKMIEYLVFVQTGKSEVFYSIFAAVPDFARVQAQFEPMVESARIP